MNTSKVIRELEQKYTGKKIVKNQEENPTEILCEVEPTKEHPDHSLAIAVIDKSIPHVHKKTTEVYRIIKGKLKLYVDEKVINLNEEDKYEIEAGRVHWAEGKETWLECYSKPGWTFEDYILIDHNKFAVSTYENGVSHLFLVNN